MMEGKGVSLPVFGEEGDLSIPSRHLLLPMLLLFPSDFESGLVYRINTTFENKEETYSSSSVGT
jgi:hypothetical protein